MDVLAHYVTFRELGKQPCGRGDPKRGAKMNEYRIAKQRLFEALKVECISGRLQSTRADRLMKVISESSQNPEAFWGSSKTASSNQAIFVHEKNEYLFEELLRCWLEKNDTAVRAEMCIRRVED